MSTTPSATEPSHPDSAQPPGEQASSSTDCHNSLGPPLDSQTLSRRRKAPMLDFKWGGDLVRKTLPVPVIPRWLDPLYVDVADPRELPLCWYGVPFVDSLVFGFAERVGLASYYDKPNLRLKAGDLDIFETWARLEMWFKKKSGLKLDWILVWGERFPTLTFWSNHQLLRITKDMFGDVCDLIDDMGYGPEFELMWYLDRNVDY